MKEGWVYKKLSDIATSMYRGSGIKREQVTPEGIPCVRYGEIYTTYHIAFDNCISHTKEDEISSKKYFEHGDILFAITGESVEEIGMSIAYLGNEKCLAGGDIVVMKHNQNPKYLSYALLSPSAIKQKGWGKVKLKVVHTNIPSLKEISIPVPSLSEQQSIVDYFDSSFAKIDAMKANAEKALNEAKALFQASLKSLLEPKDGWQEKTFGELYDVRDGTHDSPSYYAQGYPLVTSKNLKGDYIDFNNVKFICEEDYLKINERSKVDIGDVLFAMIGTIGNATIVETEPFYAIKNMALFKISHEQSSKFLKYLLDSNYILDDMHNKSNGTTQKFVSLGFLRKYKVKVPSLIEQLEIVASIESIKAKADQLQANYDQIAKECDALKQAILRQVFE